jgi:hypothetical protein
VESDFTGSTHRITHDLVNDTVTVELEQVGGIQPNARVDLPLFGQGSSYREVRSRYTVSRKDPATASLVSEHIYRIGRPEGEIRIEANESLASDADTFRFQTRVEIRVDGKTHFTRSWRASRRRLLD